MFNNFVRSRDFIRQIMSKEFPLLRKGWRWGKGDRGSSKALMLLLGTRWVGNSVLRLPRFSGKHRDNVKSSARPQLSNNGSAFISSGTFQRKPTQPKLLCFGVELFRNGRFTPR